MEHQDIYEDQGLSNDIFFFLWRTNIMYVSPAIYAPQGFFHISYSSAVTKFETNLYPRQQHH